MCACRLKHYSNNNNNNNNNTDDDHQAGQTATANSYISSSDTITYNTKNNKNNNMNESNSSSSSKNNNSNNSSSKTTTTIQHFSTSLLEAHNKLRVEYGNVRALKLDDELSKLAQEHADYLAAKQSKLENSAHEHVGENLYYLESSDGSYTAKQVIDFWLKRSNMTVSGSGATRPTKTNHFTQIVWKSSKKLGVGTAKALNGATYVVAFYEPRGNVTNYLNQNVIIPDEKKATTGAPPLKNAANSMKSPSSSTFFPATTKQQQQQRSTDNRDMAKYCDDPRIIDALEGLFKNVDKDKSGKISLTKTKKLFQQINKNFNTIYTSADARQLFEKCTKNPEGRITLEDFKTEFPYITPLPNKFLFNDNV